jgi:hypothetical protein
MLQTRPDIMTIDICKYQLFHGYVLGNRIGIHPRARKKYVDAAVNLRTIYFLTIRIAA